MDALIRFSSHLKRPARAQKRQVHVILIRKRQERREDGKELGLQCPRAGSLQTDLECRSYRSKR